jgi:hypothetical protein
MREKILYCVIKTKKMRVIDAAVLLSSHVQIGLCYNRIGIRTAAVTEMCIYIYIYIYIYIRPTIIYVT